MGRAMLGLVLALTVLALGSVACGGSDDRDDALEIDTALVRSLEEELATLDAGPGLGEGGPPNPLAGWNTDFAKHAVPLREFRSGGPRKDGIPAVDRPRFARASEVDYLEPDEPVVALELDDTAKAYPIQILIWHEIVNDTVAGVPVAVTFCPLCNTAIAFDRRVDGRTLDFGTTGNVRDSDLVMYDRQTESWWQQFGGRALVGELTGARLEQLPARIVAWREFLRLHPGGDVLTRETGFERSYGQNPYLGYDDADTPPFFVTRNADDARLAPKERVVFVERGDAAVAIPFSTLRKRRTVAVDVDGRRLLVRWRAGIASPLSAPDVASGRDVGAAEVLEDGVRVPFAEPFWFAVAAFRPDVVIVQ